VFFAVPFQTEEFEIYISAVFLCHAVNEKKTVKMIKFMLYTASEQTTAFTFDSAVVKQSCTEYHA
jgi:hypothetical protein